MATNFSPCKGSYVLNQFPSNVMFGMNGFHVSASGAIQGHHGPLVKIPIMRSFKIIGGKRQILMKCCIYLLLMQFDGQVKSFANILFLHLAMEVFF